MITISMADFQDKVCKNLQAIRRILRESVPSWTIFELLTRPYGRRSRLNSGLGSTRESLTNSWNSPGLAHSLLLDLEPATADSALTGKKAKISSFRAL